MVSMRLELAGPVREAGWTLAALIVLVLLTACANVAQMLLTRTAERQQELAVRAALGASRARLTQQLMTEALVLTLAGALFGLIVAQWGLPLIQAVIPAGLAAQEYSVMDWRVLTFATLLALLTGILFGVLPNWVMDRAQFGGRGGNVRWAMPGAGLKRFRMALVAMQVAITLTLVTSAGALGNTFLHLLRTDLGLRPDNVVTMSVSLQGLPMRGPAQWQYYQQALERLRELPGVAAAGAVSHLPMATDAYMAASVKLESGGTAGPVITSATMPGYFAAIGTSIVAGRDFLWTERRSPEPPVIVNEAFARTAGLGLQMLGHHLTVPWTKKPYVVVGMVKSVRLGGPDHPAAPMIYWPVEEEPPPALTFVVKTRGRGEESALRKALASLRPEVPIYNVQTLEARVAEVLGRPKFYTTATVFLAALAMLLAMAGIYGVAAQSVAERQREMGLRMALGATSWNVRSMVVKEGLLAIIAGLGLGVAGVIAASRFFHHLMESAQAVDAATCAAGIGVLLCIALTASWSATTRILAIDPSEAMRAE
jgi:predicted permease